MLLRSVGPDTPNGIRTRVTALKGRRPGPLDDGGTAVEGGHNVTLYDVNPNANYVNAIADLAGGDWPERARQAERLAELMSNDAQQKEAPLRRDVRSLGILLGRVLKEQGGDELFATVEMLRELLIKQREEHADSRRTSD